MSDELKQATESLRILLSECGAVLKRAEAAEAEVARLKALLEAKQPYTPRVGDVVKVQEYRFVFTGPMLGDPDWFGNDTLRGWDLRAKRRDAWSSTAYFRYLRRATAEERAAAGLPAEAPAATEGALAEAYAQGVVDGQKHQVAIASNEAPAAPLVLPEHLAWIEASAKLARFEFATKVDPDEKKECVAEALLAAHTLRAAVARRDGGAK